MTLTPLRSPGLPGGPADLGRISWRPDDDTWTWAPSVYALHGYPVGAVRPTTAVMLAHKHPGDRYACVDAIHAGLLRQEPIVSEHRIWTGLVAPDRCCC